MRYTRLDRYRLGMYASAVGRRMGWCCTRCASPQQFCLAFPLTLAETVGVGGLHLGAHRGDRRLVVLRRVASNARLRRLDH